MRTHVRVLCTVLTLVLSFLILPQVQGQTQIPTTPLKLFKNYFVTGGYVVGSVRLRGTCDPTAYTTGKSITIPDQTVSPVTGTMQVNAGRVPDGAEIVAAFLYWQTVEATPTSTDGKIGSFNNYKISGVPLQTTGPVSWSAGGCIGASNGTKTLVTYRADVRPFLNIDANENVNANGTFNVGLRDSGSNGAGVPITLGATLVIVYRVLADTADYPLTSVVLYDGTYAPSNSASTFSEALYGYYQSASAGNAKITHIVGNGQDNKLETVTLNGSTLDTLYPGFPPFPGFYNASWDSPTWNVTGNLPSDNVTALVTPNSSNSGCVDWGAIIMSTRVKDTDGDGLLDAWENANQYVDYENNEIVKLPGAVNGQKDLFAEIDWFQNLDQLAGSYKHSHLPKLEALDKVGKAFDNAGIKVHFDVGNAYPQPSTMQSPAGVACGTVQGKTVYCDPYIIPGGTGGNAISEKTLLCTDGTSLCAFPSFPNNNPPAYVPTLGWKGGFLYVRNNATDTTTGLPLGNFQPGRSPSYHYVLFGHALSEARSYWSTFQAAHGGPTTIAGALSVTVDASHQGTITLQSVPDHFLKPSDPDPGFGDLNLNRITIEGALVQRDINGTYPLSIQSSGSDGTTATTTLTVTFPATVPAGTYTFTNEPWLGVAYGGPGTSSGHSDLGGGDSLVTFGLWPADDPTNCQPDPSQALTAQKPAYCVNQVGTVQAEAGTLMHELGHPLTLTHGGAYYLNPGTDGPGEPTYGQNCKPNFISVMNYLFQIRGFPDGAIDYSRLKLADLNESSLSESIGLGSPTALHPTRWYAPLSSSDPLDQMLNLKGARAAANHCDGTPITDGTQMVRVDGTTTLAVGQTYSTPIDWNNDFITPDFTGYQDVNFNGPLANSADSAFVGFKDWDAVDLTQIGARANAFGFSGSGSADIRGGSADIRGGSADIRGGSADIRGGSADIRGGAEADFAFANATVDAPTGATAVYEKANKRVKLTWSSPGFGQIRTYDIYRMLGAYDPVLNPLTNATYLNSVTSVDGVSPPATTYYDYTIKSNVTYTYFVTAKLGDTRKSQSGPSMPPAQVLTK
ncbi:MAG: hypothetical protein ACM3JB_01340 [Acidobacteriaceae bacterium]